MCSFHCQSGQGTWGRRREKNWEQVWQLQGWSSNPLLVPRLPPNQSVFSSPSMPTL